MDHPFETETSDSLVQEQDDWESQHRARLSALDVPVPQALIRSRVGGGGKTFSYIAASTAIGLANKLFGNDGWSSQVVGEPQFRPVGTTSKGDPITLVTCVVRAAALGQHHDGIGAGTAIGETDQAFETAIKGAESDGLKRALVKFGNALGLSLYDTDAPEAPKAPATAPKVPTKPTEGKVPCINFDDCGNHVELFGTWDSIPKLLAYRAKTYGHLAPEGNICGKCIHAAKNS